MPDFPTLPTRTPWDGFPDTVTHTTIAKLKSLPDYRAAKTGDVAAALRLSRALLQPAKLANFPGVDYLVPIVQFDRQEPNAIPVGLALALRERLPGAPPVLLDVVQANQVHHTGADAPTRLTQQPVFAGVIPRPGARYLILDDVTTYGSSLANLRGHIEAQGGKVVLASTLAASLFSTRLVPNATMIARITERHAAVTDQFRSRVGFSFDRLTNKEAYYLDGLRSPDALRGILAAGVLSPAVPGPARGGDLPGGHRAARGAGSDEPSLPSPALSEDQRQELRAILRRAVDPRTRETPDRGVDLGPEV